MTLRERVIGKALFQQPAPLRRSVPGPGGIRVISDLDRGFTTCYANAQWFRDHFVREHYDRALIPSAELFAGLPAQRDFFKKLRRRWRQPALPCRADRE
jgi:hypothetical protein